MRGGRSRRIWCCAVVLGVLGAAPAAAQTVEARMGRFFNSTGWTSYRLGITRPLVGILGSQLHADVLHRYGGDPGGLVGVGADLTAFRSGHDGPYLIAGLSGGLGSESSGDLSNFWGSWSAGLGYDLFPLSFLSVGAEARWRELSLGKRDGLELAGGVTIYLSGGPPRARPLAQPPSPNAPIGPSEIVAGPGESSVAAGDPGRLHHRDG